MYLPRKWLINFSYCLLVFFFLLINLISLVQSTDDDKIISYKGYSVIRVVPRTKDSFDYLTNLTYSKVNL